jgi:hypothetical protein
MYFSSVILSTLDCDRLSGIGVAFASLLGGSVIGSIVVLFFIKKPSVFL